MTSTLSHDEQHPVQEENEFGQQRAAKKSSIALDIALVATFAAFIAACAVAPSITLVGIPAPITLQTLGVMLAGLTLGARRGILAVLLYLAVGAAGLPVFARGGSGLAPFTGPTVGYLIAFPIVAFLVGLLVKRIIAAPGKPDFKPSFTSHLLAIVAAFGCSLVSVHLLGVAGMTLRVPMAFSDALTADAAFIPGDIVKTTCAVLLASALLKAFPQLKELR
ncbi:biotin transporter BioY [Timonella sp. A28]|uniref:biotin transporter BioY n=1 Tax=Timonella sp. A28 TaxID=3442640 RepID=UPI003EBE30E7